jgi:hypothetical protein
MRFPSLSLLAILACASLAPAQLAPPAPQLAKFDLMLGNWEGEGVVRMTADAPEQKWTSVMTVEKVLDGYFVEEDTRVDFGPEVPAPILFRTIYGWDAAREQYFYFSLSNLGFGSHGSAFWTDDGKLLVSNTSAQQGTPTTDQSAAHFMKEAAQFRLERSVAGGPFFTHVEGRYRKGTKSFSASEGTGELAFVPPAGEMAAIRDMLGKWKYKGQISPMPGMGPFPMSGEEHLRPILGGHAYMSNIQGHPSPGAPKTFAGQFYIAWDAANRCYATLNLENYGGFTVEQGHRAGENKMVFLSSTRYYGMPQVQRLVFEWHEGKDKVKLVGDRAGGDSKVDRSLDVEYERVKG